MAKATDETTETSPESTRPTRTKSQDYWKGYRDGASSFAKHVTSKSVSDAHAATLQEINEGSK